MNVAVIGAGAVGAVLAAATAGPVTVCVRTPIPALELTGVFAGPVDARLVSSVSGLSAPGGPAPAPADVVFVTVKATDNRAAGAWLPALCGPATVVVVVQNGLDHAARFPGCGSVVVPGLAYLAAERLGPGRVRHLSGRHLEVPAAVASVVAAAVPRMKVTGTDDIETAAWRKLLVNLVANPITALTMRRVSVMASPGVADLARGLLAEAVAVGRAAGAGISESDIEPIVAGATRWGPETGSSMLYDRLDNRPMEHQFLTGEIVRRGRTFGVPTPLNSALLALLEAIDAGVRSSRSEPVG